MFPRITKVEYLTKHILLITFADGRQGELDLAQKILGRGGVFRPLEDTEFFAKVKVDPEVGTLVWPNDVDLDPDVLYCEVTNTPLPAPAKI